MTLRGTLTIALLALTAGAQALDFKGVRMGASEEEFKSVGIPNHIKCENDTPSFRRCNAHGGVAWGPTRLKWIAGEFLNNKLVTIFGLFPQYDYLEMRAGLLEKFGKPSHEETKIFGNRMGAKFESRETFWREGGHTLALSEYCNDADTACFQLADMGARAGMQEERKAKAKESAKKL